MQGLGFVLSAAVGAGCNGFRVSENRPPSAAQSAPVATVSEFPRTVPPPLSPLRFAEEKGWAQPGVGLDEMRADLVTQRQARQRDLEMTRKMAELREQRRSYCAGQAQRYARFIKALNVLRATHRDDPLVLAVLEQFKRRSRKGTSSSNSNGAEQAAA